MIIDFHTHIFSPKIKENRAFYAEKDPCFGLLYADPKARIATAEDLIASMDENEIDISVVLNTAWTSYKLCRETNDYIIESVSRYSKRLVGFGTIQLNDEEKALLEIERCAQGGLRGIGELRSDDQKVDFGDKDTMAPLVQSAKKHNLIILTHSSEPVGHIYSGKGKITPDVLYRFISNFPDALLVCAHLGGGLPFYALMPEVAKALEKVFFDTAAVPYLYQEKIFDHLVKLVGAEKILLGSDYPLIKQGRMVKYIRSLDLTEEAKSMILGENAIKLLGLGS
jgi:hypothetical protein